MTTTQDETDPEDDNAMWLDDAHVDPVWIAQELGLAGCTSCTAIDISNQMRVGARVRDGATLRVTLTYDNKDNNHPTTLIVKQIATAPSRALAQQLGLAREALFYKHLAPQIEGNDVLPRIYNSVGHMVQGRKRVVMEDLGTGVDSGILFGPGNPNNWNRDNMANEAARVGNPSPHHVARTTFEAMARIHALYWNQTELLDDANAWLRGHSWIQERGRDTWEASQQLLHDLWKAYLQMDQDNQEDKLIEWDPVVRASVEKAIAGISWEAQLQRLNAHNPQCQWTLVHGDFWPGNVLWMEGGQLKLVDWEMVGLGSGPQELGQYVLSNMTREDRRACEDHLVRAYYKVLQQHGVTTLSWDKCWKEYTVGGVERWLWFLTYFCGKGMKEWAQFFHNQIAEFMSDHHLTETDIVQPRP